MRRVAASLAIGLFAACVQHPQTTSARHVTRIAVLGDSVAHGAGDETGRGISGWLSVQTANCGINGARTFNTMRQLRDPAMRSLLRSCDAVVVSIGGNDLYGDSRARLMATLAPRLAMQHVASRVEAIVRRIRAINPDAQLFLLGLYNPYPNARFLDRQVNLWDALLITRFAAERHVVVIRIADLLRSTERISPLDHFHPSALGYALIAARIAPALQ